MKINPGGASDDHKLTGSGCFGPSGKVSVWIAERLAEGPTGIVAWGVDYSAVVSSPRWALCNHSLSLIYVDVSMQRHLVNITEPSYSLTNNCYRRQNYFDKLARAAEQEPIPRSAGSYLLGYLY
jgi:hypothetical protein